VDIALDASSGATNMTAALGSTGSYAPQYRKALFTQIPDYTVNLYISGEDVSGIHFLPMITGDIITFVFDVTVGNYTRGSNVMPTQNTILNRITRDVNNFYPTTTADLSWNTDISNDIIITPATILPYNSGSLTISSTTKRRVALKVALGTKDVTSGKKFILKDDVLLNGTLDTTIPT
jgi:hypothetical protein